MRFWRNWRNWHLGWPRGQGWIRIAAAAIALLCIGAVILRYVPLYANSPSHPLSKPHPRRVVMLGERPRALGQAKRLGQQDGATQMQLSIGLRLSNPKGFQKLLADLENPHSQSYHKYLTPRQFTDKFAPSPAAVNAVQRFLQDSGLKVTSVASNRMQINASGSAAQIEQAFGAPIGRYQLGKATFFAPDHDPTVPETISPYLVNIGGLDSLFHMESHSVFKPHSGTAPQVVPAGGYTPTDLRNAYDAGTLISTLDAAVAGTGHAYGPVAIFELAPYIPGDITAFRSQFGLPNPPIINNSVDGAAVTGDAVGTAEADLDIEVVSALAPNATQWVYVGPNTIQGVNDTYNFMAINPSFRVISTSWGVCEPFTTQDELTQLHTYFATAQSQGKTIFAASGDSGSDDCQSGGDAGFNTPPAVDSPASDPLVVGVGGTSLTLSGSSYGSEITWNNSSGSGGGGLSNAFAQPAYQVGGGLNNEFAVGQRQVPDVSANADPNTGYAFYCTSTPDCGKLGWQVIGGTSAAAPLWAAIFDYMDTYKQLETGAFIGVGNSVLYHLFANAQTHSPYHDVTTTNNNLDYQTPPYNADYPATTCYDLASGMGSLDAWNMTQDLVAGVSAGGGGPCPATTVTRTNLIQDGGFEQSPSPWQLFSSGEYQLLTGAPHDGAQSFYACGYPNCDDRVSQTFTVPNTVNSATLQLWVTGTTSFLYLTNSPPCYDHFTVTLATPDGTVFDSVQATCKMYAPGWTVESIPITAALQAHQGQQVTLTIRGKTSNEAVFPQFYTTWYVDDVALYVS